MIKKLAHKYKKIIMALTIFLIYLSLFLYQNVYGLNNTNSSKLSQNDVDRIKINRVSKDVSIHFHKLKIFILIKYNLYENKI